MGRDRIFIFKQMKQLELTYLKSSGVEQDDEHFFILLSKFHVRLFNSVLTSFDMLQGLLNRCHFKPKTTF